MPRASSNLVPLSEVSDACLEIGDVLDDKYQITDRMGAVGGAVVYRAEHITIQRPVEVKILAPHLDPAGVDAARLLREARAAGSVAHRNVQSVLDSGADGAGRPYVVFEALGGCTFASLLAEAPMGVGQARASELVLEVLEGLRAIHRGGVVHRGITPECLYVVRACGAEVVKIGGFEHAAFVAEGASADVVASPRIMPYAAPEVQRAGRVPDPRSDLYSVGVVLRALLTGDATSDQPMGDTARRAVERATAIDPDQRFSDAAQMQAAIALITGTADVPARDERRLPTDPLVADLQYLKLRRSTWTGDPPVAHGSARVELLPVLLSIEGIWRALGPRGWDRLVERMPEVEAWLPAAGRVQEHQREGIPVPQFARVLAAADDIGGAGDLGFVARLGETVAYRGLRRLVVGVPDPLTPAGALAMLDEIWPVLTRQGRTARYDRNGPRASLVIRDQVEPSLELCALYAGFLRGTLRRTGASRVVVQVKACQALGDPVCAYGIACEP
jgi:serine/threonine-protein kinase